MWAGILKDIQELRDSVKDRRAFMQSGEEKETDGISSRLTGLSLDENE